MNIIRSFLAHALKYKMTGTVVVVVFALLLSSGLWVCHLSDRIATHTKIGSVAVGGMTRDQAAVRLQEALDAFTDHGITLSVEGSEKVITPDSIGLDLNLSEAVEGAFKYGHQGSELQQTGERISALWSDRRTDAPVHLDDGALRTQISRVADSLTTERRDVRLKVDAAQVALLTDTEPGRALDPAEAFDVIRGSLLDLSNGPIPLRLHDDKPRADPVKAQTAVNSAEKMISRPLVLQYEDMQFRISREKLGSWITSEYDGDQLIAGLDKTAMTKYVTSVAADLNIDSEPPHITTENGKVTSFKPPKVGRAVQEDKLIAMISDSVTARTGADKAGDTLVVPLKTNKLAPVGLDPSTGITELIGHATTTFTGSPKNRISNIKNGVKYLSGTIIQPGEEFSTLGTLGVIDNSTGYLTELVIKGDRTTPEFGGGLCQVSTTLFRAVMNTGLPVTARQNHSFRVSYYEKDANGKVIGPGLDATIYQPNTDFKFLNDTGKPVMLIGYVSGDKVTFELYGTNDGRTSEIIGPKTLTTIPAGDPEYIETTDLPVGTKKQVETAHPGGSAEAKYIITYADGIKKTTDYKSYYRRWPAKYLVGVSALSTPTPTFPVSPPMP